MGAGVSAIERAVSTGRVLADLAELAAQQRVAIFVGGAAVAVTPRSVSVQDGIVRLTVADCATPGCGEPAAFGESRCRPCAEVFPARAMSCRSKGGR